MKKITSPFEIQVLANDIRKDILKSLSQAGSGHSAGALGLADIFTALYFSLLNHDPQNPNWEERDRLFLSNGHVCPALYAVLANAGYFPKKELKTMRKLSSRLQGHPVRESLPGLESTSGPLGSGLAQAAGYAYGAKMDNKRFRVYAITSDAEHQEGNHWEAVLFAAKYKLNNLTSFVDRNFIQISGSTEEIMPLEPLKAKYEAFLWNVIEIDGNNVSQIFESVEKARKETQKPTVIIANTIPGKGVPFMEGRFEWHGKSPTNEEAEAAIKALDKA